MRAIEVPHVRGQGIDLNALSAAVQKHRIKAVLLCVTCHNPIGECVTDERKAEIVRVRHPHTICR